MLERLLPGYERFFAAALAVALTYAVVFPMLALPVLVLGLDVGYSRLALGCISPGV